MYKYIDVIVGGQFGSESKGRVSADIVRQRIAQQQGQPDQHPVYSIRVGGPNAGHIVHDAKGVIYKMQQIPVGFLHPEAQLHVAAGSEVDLETLRAEATKLNENGFETTGRLTVHPQATILTPEHRRMEQDSDLNARTGSTAHGIGAARSERLWRRAPVARDYVRELKDMGVEVADPVHEQAVLADHDPTLSPIVVIEGTQGYGLGLHSGYYPQCTSNDTRAIDFCAMAGINPWDTVNSSRFTVHVVVRPYPIRVAGNSGPLAGETTWEQLGLEPEHTTVTNKVRRVGTFEPRIVQEAILANGRSRSIIHLAMADQVDSSLRGVQGVVYYNQLSSSHGPIRISAELMDIVEQLQQVAPVVSLGTSPTTQIYITGSRD